MYLIAPDNIGILLGHWSYHAYYSEHYINIAFCTTYLVSIVGVSFPGGLTLPTPGHIPDLVKANPTAEMGEIR